MTSTTIVHFRMKKRYSIDRAPQLRLGSKRKHKAYVEMEWISKRYIDSTKDASQALLKAQLLAGQHTLDKERFVKVAKQNGWILQIPERLLV